MASTIAQMPLTHHPLNGQSRGQAGMGDDGACEVPFAEHSRLHHHRQRREPMFANSWPKRRWGCSRAKLAEKQSQAVKDGDGAVGPSACRLSPTRASGLAVFSSRARPLDGQGAVTGLWCRGPRFSGDLVDIALAQESRALVKQPGSRPPEESSFGGPNMGAPPAGQREPAPWGRGTTTTSVVAHPRSAAVPLPSTSMDLPPSSRPQRPDPLGDRRRHWPCR